jgi:hypothetical protein
MSSFHRVSRAFLVAGVLASPLSVFGCTADVDDAEESGDPGDVGAEETETVSSELGGRCRWVLRRGRCPRIYDPEQRRCRPAEDYPAHHLWKVCR